MEECWIDYKKAFDSVPHDWLIKALEIIKVDKKIIAFLKHSMLSWSTRVSLSTPGGTIVTDTIPILRGIFQGDAFSALWFVICMNPMSNLLKDTDLGFQIRANRTTLYTLNHLAFMDDFKLYAANPEQLKFLLTTVEEFSKDIQMEFGLDKCKTLSIVQGRLSDTSYELEDGRAMEVMHTVDTYKYLGAQQSRRIEHSQMKNELRTEFSRRVRKILKTGLNAKNYIKAINTYAVPVLSYSFGILSWSNTNAEGLQRKVRVLMTKARKHHPKSAIERVTLPREMGGRGLIDINNQRMKQTQGLRNYFFGKAETSELHRAICDADDFTSESKCNGA